MILTYAMTKGVINKRKAIRKLFHGANRTIFSDLVVGSYIFPDLLSGEKTSCEQYFSTIGGNFLSLLRTEQDLKEQNSKLFNQYEKLKKFKHEFEVRFYEFIIVIEIIPNSKSAEYVVLGFPLVFDVANKDENYLDLWMNKIKIVSIFSKVGDLKEQLRFTAGIDHLLAYLETGVGKKWLDLF